MALSSAQRQLGRPGWVALESQQTYTRALRNAAQSLVAQRPRLACLAGARFLLLTRDTRSFTYDQAALISRKTGKLADPTPDPKAR